MNAVKRLLAAPSAALFAPRWNVAHTSSEEETKGMAVAACGGDDNDMSCFVPIKIAQPYLDDPHLYLC